MFKKTAWFVDMHELVCIIPVCRNHQLKKKNNKTNNVGKMQNTKRCLGDVPILLSEVEEEQRPSWEAAGLCDGEGERAYNGYALHFSF